MSIFEFLFFGMPFEMLVFFIIFFGGMFLLATIADWFKSDD